MPHAKWLSFPIAFVFSAALAIADDQPEFHPLFDQSRLIVGDEEFAPIEVIAPWRDYKRVGERLFYTDGPRVVEVADDYTTVVGEVASTDGLDLVWLGHSGTTAYFAGRRDEEGWDAWDWRPEPVIRRLDLETLTWLDSWGIELAELNEDDRFTYSAEYLVELSDEGPRPILGHALVADDGLFVLTLEADGDERVDEHVLTYQVDAFPFDDEEPHWSHRFLSRDGNGTAIRDAPLYQTFLTHQWGTTCTPLMLFEPEFGDAESELLVCGGPTENLVWLDVRTGEESGRVGAVWEFEPVYSGIGEYVDGLSRFGIDWEISRLLENESGPPLNDLTAADWRKIDDYRQRRARFYEDYAPRVVAGPLLVPMTDDSIDCQFGFGDPTTPRLVVVVECGRIVQDGFLHRPDTVFYELRERGPGSGFGFGGDRPRGYEVVNFLKLPLVPAGGPGSPYSHSPVVTDNAILWWNRDASLARINVKDFTLDWFRGNPTGAPYWSRNDPWNTPATASESVCFLAHTVRHSQDQRSVLINLDAVKVENGDGTEFQIRIPVAKQGSALRVRTYVHSLATDGANFTLDFGSSSVAGRIRFELPPGLRDL